MTDDTTAADVLAAQEAIQCPACADVAQSATCPYCDGSGFGDPEDSQGWCGACGGTGFAACDLCGELHGEGTVTRAQAAQWLMDQDDPPGADWDGRLRVVSQARQEALRTGLPVWTARQGDHD